MWTVKDEPIDSQEAAPLLRAFFTELVYRYYREPVPPAQVDAAMAEDPSDGFAAFMVAFFDGKPAGCVGLRVSGVVARLFVAPEYRRRGGGHVLLGAVEETGRELGFDRLRMDTREDLSEARALFASAGYEEVVPFNSEPFAQHWFEKRL